MQEFDWGVLKRVLLLEVSQTVVDETRSEVLAAKKVVSTNSNRLQHLILVRENSDAQ